MNSGVNWVVVPFDKQTAAHLTKELNDRLLASDWSVRLIKHRFDFLAFSPLAPYDLLAVNSLKRT